MASRRSEPRPRSVHPPLTDREWLTLKVKAAEKGWTIADAVADALRRRYKLNTEAAK